MDKPLLTSCINWIEDPRSLVSKMFNRRFSLDFFDFAVGPHTLPVFASVLHYKSRRHSRTRLEEVARLSAPLWSSPSRRPTRVIDPCLFQT